MQAGLFDVLQGQFSDRAPLQTVPDDQQRLLSVISNLTRLFNTRRGTIKHLPDYGLPDVTAAYRDNPRSVDDVRRMVKKAVQKYEPRLQHVRLTHRETDRHEMNLVFILMARLDSGERVQFQTTFASHDLAQVNAQQRTTI